MNDNSRNRPPMGRGLKTLLIVLGFLCLVLGATAVELALRSHQQRPFLGNVFAFAILNINILLLAVVILLFGRQLAKFYFEKKSSPFGAGFRTKLVSAFIALSIIPAGLLFIIAGGLLTGSVKYWFGPRVESTMRNSIALVRGYTEDQRTSAVHYADQIAEELREGKADPLRLNSFANTVMEQYDIDMVEIYGSNGRLAGFAGDRDYAWAMSEREFIARALGDGSASESVRLKQGYVVRAAKAFYDKSGRMAGLVAVDFVLPSVISNNISDITRFYDEYWNLRTFKNPLKESYMLSFMLITLVILFAALWFGLYISKGITVPITTLAEATHRISQGDYNFRIDIKATDEIGVLVDSFKRMTRDLKLSQEKLNEANLSLSQTNELLKQRGRFIETVLENVNTGVITIDRAGRISTVNRAAERITSLEPAAIVGRNYREVFEFHQLDEIREQIRKMAEFGTGVERDIQITVNRRTLTLRLFVSPLHDTDCGYLGILVVFDDLTELIKAQRTAAWKEVATRIAHEVKNPLTPIQLSAQRLRKRYLEGTGDYGKIIEECTGTIITQVEGMKALVDEFSKFARMPEAVPQPNDLHAIIDEVATLYTGAHKDLNIVKEYGAVPVVNVDREQLKRVFMNLFDNAVSAMDGRGRLLIKTAHDVETGKARVEVADEGTGILPEDREKLFQPYFSKNKAGTGLGLAIVSRIISDHGGYIRVEGNAPKGARFIIELPVGA